MGREYVNKLKEFVTKLPSQESVGNKVCEDESLVKSQVINEEHPSHFHSIICEKE